MITPAIDGNVGFRLAGWDRDGLYLVLEVTLDAAKAIALVPPDYYEMNRKELCAYIDRIEEKMLALENEESDDDDEADDAFEAWEDEYEELEELLCDVECALEQMDFETYKKKYRFEDDDYYGY